MPHFYKGVGVGTFLHTFNVSSRGIGSRNPGASPTATAIMHHIARGTTTSPYISLTRSYAVAERYAIDASRTLPTPGTPAHVYEVDIPDPPPHGLNVIDPLAEIASNNANPLRAPSYHHDGGPSFLLGVVDPVSHRSFLRAPVVNPPGMAGISRPPNLSLELEAMVFALRDAEVLVVGQLPRALVINRFDVH
jgi:hypothetical protein